MSKTAVTLLREQFKDAHGWLEGVIGDVEQKVAEEQINPNAQKIGAQYIHIIYSIDSIVLGRVAGKKFLAIGTWKDKKGYTPDDDEGGPMAWSKKVKFDLKKLKKYCNAVHEAVDKYLASLDDKDLSEEIDMSDWGMGKQKKSAVINIALFNTLAHVGEIANMKGYKGLKGYPF